MSPPSRITRHGTRILNLSTSGSVSGFGDDGSPWTISLNTYVEGGALGVEKRNSASELIRHTRRLYLLFSQRKYGTLAVGTQNGGALNQKTDVLQGTRAL